MSWPRGGLEAVPACPVCGDASRRLLHDQLRDLAFGTAPGEWTLYQCAGCGAGYLDPRPSAATIGLAYERYYTHAPAAAPAALSRVERVRRALKNGYLNARYGYQLQPASRLGAFVTALLPLRRARVERGVRHLRRPPFGARLLDLGCGSGEFLVEMRAAGWSVAGLDADAAAVAVARAAGLDIALGEAREGAFADASFDVVTLHHFIEHVHDPVAVLRAARGYLRPGGLLWIATPNLASRGARRFGEAWRGLEPPRHLVLFTPGALRRALTLAGFGAVRAEAGVGPYGMTSASLGLRARAAGRSEAPSRLERFDNHLADWLALLRPAFGEEIIATARR